MTAIDEPMIAESSQNLLEQVKTNTRNKNESAEAEYLRLLVRADHPEPGDVERLTEIFDSIGLAVADFESDLAALAALRKVRANLEEMPTKLAEAEREYAATYTQVNDEKRQMLHSIIEKIIEKGRWEEFVHGLPAFVKNEMPLTEWSVRLDQARLLPKQCKARENELLNRVNAIARESTRAAAALET